MRAVTEEDKAFIEAIHVKRNCRRLSTDFNKIRQEYNFVKDTMNWFRKKTSKLKNDMLDCQLPGRRSL